MAPSQLQIKTNALSRLLKEEKLYHQEVDDISKKIDRMKADGSDEYEIKKMVLEDSKKMIPELGKKIKGALDKLKQLLETDVDEDKTLAEEKIKEAEELLG